MSIRTSEWLELMHNGVECTFCILKGRWSILRYIVCFASINQCDKLWLTTYCVLNNIILLLMGYTSPGEYESCLIGEK